MKAAITDAATLGAVSIADLAAYLRATGWDVAEPVGSRVYSTWHRSVDGEQFELTVPARPDLRDLPRRMAEVFHTLAAVEARSQLELLQDVRRAQADVLRVRLHGAALDGGRMPLDGGSRVVARLRDAMLAAACAALAPRPNFPTRKPDAAMNFVRTARLAPPEAGSFVVVVETPLPPALHGPRGDAATDEPFERRATLTLARALRHTRTAITSAAATGAASSFTAGTREGLSSNFCDAVAELLSESGATTVTFSQTFAPSRPAPLDASTPVSFRGDETPLLRAGASFLRENAPRVDFELEGQVLRLESAAPAKGGVVVVAATVDERVRRVRVSLDADDYALALAAHREGHTFACEGELQRDGGTLVLANPRAALVREEG